MSTSQPQTDQSDDQKRIREAKKAVDREYLNLGRELFLAFSSGTFKEGGFKSFDDYAISQGVEPGRANRLRRVFKKFSQDLGIPFNQMLELGYEGLKAIEPVINRANKSIWLHKAATLPYDQLVAEVRDNKPPRRRRKEVTQNSSKKTVYQPEDAAKLISKINDENLKPSSDGSSVTSDDVVYVKNIYLLGDQNTVFETALEDMERRTGSTKRGYLLTSALMEYLSHEATRSLTDDKRMYYYMGVLERRYKGKLIWVKDKKVAAELQAMLKVAEDSVDRGNDVREADQEAETL